MKYKVGDKVRIKSIDWYNKNKNERGNIRDLSTESFVEEMSKYCGLIAVIEEILDDVNSKYKLNIDNRKWNWTYKMFEEPIVLNNDFQLGELKISIPQSQRIIFDKFAPNETELVLGDDFEMKEENGVFKVVRKRKEYPKTYNECCKVIGINRYDIEIDLPQPYQQKMFNFFKLLLCRDAYWKITGEEMGLGKAWKPDWEDESNKFTIGYFYNDIDTEIIRTYTSYPLAFPTEEMRGIFLENFKEEIEQCKELL